MVRWWVVLWAGCSSEPSVVPVQTTLGPQAIAAPVKLPANLGVVRETMDSAGYTYAKLDVCGTDVWVASTTVKVPVDAIVEVEGALEMKDFHSNSLDRDFASILFARSMAVSTEAVDCRLGSWVDRLPAAPPDVPRPTASMPAEKPAVPKRQGRVLETMVSGGYRYARVDFCGFEQWVAGPSAELVIGQTVSTDTGMRMTEFHSSTLNRTFASIDFVNSLDVLQGEPVCG